MDAHRKNDQQTPPGGRGRANARVISLVIERTVNGSSHGNVVNVNPVLELISVDHHFVPTTNGSDEDLQIKYDILGHSNQEVKLRISNANHSPVIVYERPLTEMERLRGRGKIIKWNGATNCSSGPLKEKLINPMFGKYSVELISGDKKTKALDTHVIFRELKLEKMEWAEVYKAVTKQPTDKFPAGGGKNDVINWFKHKLNQLGYYAGPVSSNPDTISLYRAMFRYTQEHPAYPKIYEFDTFAAGDPGNNQWGWMKEWGAKVFRPESAKIIQSLENNERPYEQVLENTEVFENFEAESSLFVDHNIFYQNKDFAKEDAHAAYDAEFCNRPLLPLRAKALLLSRTDADASKPGVESPEAVGEVECEWKIFDPQEDISVVPLPPRADVKLFTKARAYLDTVHRKVDGTYGDKFNPQDNCPVEYGGIRPNTATDHKDFFSPLDPASPARIEAGTRFISKANWDSTSPSGILGANCVIFQGSYISGDNYVVQANLAFDKQVNLREFLNIHASIAALKPSFTLRKDIVKKGEPKRFLTAQSGKITIWRRTAVAEVLDWDASSYPPVDWFKIVDIFRAAHIKMIIPGTPAQRLDSVLDATAKTELNQAIVDDATGGSLQGDLKTEFDDRKNLKAFNPNGFFPLPLRTLDEYEASSLNKDGKESSKKIRFERYTKYLTNLIRGYPGYDYMIGAAKAMRKSYDRLQAKPGIIIVRTAYLPTPDWNVLLPKDIAAATRTEQAAFNPYRGVSTGMDYGIVFLDSNQYSRFKDEFFFSHEISHCLFGSHAFEAKSIGDHDTSEKNCIMYYGNNNGGERLGWGVRNVPKEYTLELTLTSFNGMPKWNDATKEFTGTEITGAKSRGKLSGKFIEEDSRVSSITGSLETVQKAINELKFEPKLILNDKSAKKPDKVFIGLVLSAKGASPKTKDGLLMVERTVEEVSKAFKPFADVKLEPLSLKDHEPRFCGKCLLKLRGWKIRTFKDPAGTTTPSEPLPEKSIAYPTKPRMEFVKYSYQSGSYLSLINGKQEMVPLDVGTSDPQDSTIKFGPLRFMHEHRLSWESTDGKLSSLKGIKTREWVKFRNPTQAAPFSIGADPDQEFYMGEADAAVGEGFDDHSVRMPSLICAYPLTAGTLIGEQWYQYKMPGEDWQNFPEAAFLLEKTVYQNGDNWVLKFKKTNWEQHNPNPFTFEVHYLIGKQPKSTPMPMNVPYKPTPTKPHLTSSGGIILEAGTQEIGVISSKKTDTTLEELQRLGFLAPKPWL